MYPQTRILAYTFHNDDHMENAGERSKLDEQLGMTLMQFWSTVLVYFGVCESVFFFNRPSKFHFNMMASKIQQRNDDSIILINFHGTTHEP